MRATVSPFRAAACHKSLERGRGGGGGAASPPGGARTGHSGRPGLGGRRAGPVPGPSETWQGRRGVARPHRRQRPEALFLRGYHLRWYPCHWGASCCLPDGRRSLCPPGIEGARQRWFQPADRPPIAARGPCAGTPRLGADPGVPARVVALGGRGDGRAGVRPVGQSHRPLLLLQLPLTGRRGLLLRRGRVLGFDRRWQRPRLTPRGAGLPAGAQGLSEGWAPSAPASPWTPGGQATTVLHPSAATPAPSSASAPAAMPTGAP